MCLNVRIAIFRAVCPRKSCNFVGILLKKGSKSNNSACFEHTAPFSEEDDCAKAVSPLF